MAQNVLACDRDQQMLLPADMREWLAECCRAAAMRVVCERPASQFGGSGKAVGDALDESERTGRGTERGGEEEGKERGRDLVAGIGEQARGADAPDPRGQPRRVVVPICVGRFALQRHPPDRRSALSEWVLAESEPAGGDAEPNTLGEGDESDYAHGAVIADERHPNREKCDCDRAEEKGEAPAATHRLALGCANTWFANHEATVQRTTITGQCAKRRVATPGTAPQTPIATLTAPLHPQLALGAGCRDSPALPAAMSSVRFAQFTSV